MGQGQVENLANNVKKLYDLWNLRVCLIISLFLQAFLMVVASLRKRHKSNLLHLWIWSTYLLANWITAYALGQTVQSPDGDLYDPQKSGELFVFWAQFLLLHLAGPDSLISFSLGDNGVWLKSLFSLLCQVVATIYSFSLLALAKNNKLWIPTMLVFTVGLIKCYERVKALVNAGFDHFGETLLPEPYPGLDYEEAVLIYRTMRGVQVEMQPDKMMMPIKSERAKVLVLSEETLLPESYPIPDNEKGFSRISVQFEMQPKRMMMPINNEDSSLEQVHNHDNIKLLCVAHSFFEDFKVLFTGSSLSFETRETSREYFLRCHHSDAFRLIEYELSYLHDLMHTKMAVLHNTLGYVRRFVCFAAVLAAFVLFFIAEKQVYAKFDIKLTYALLISTISLDIISLIKIMIFSDWSVIRRPWIRHLIPAFILKRKRWSKSIFQYNMFNYSLRKRPTRMLYSLASYVLNSTGFMDKIRAMWYSSIEAVTGHVEEFIFEELKKKSLEAQDLKVAKEACSQRGLSALLQSSSSYIKLKWSIEEFHYVESLLLWHLATELCFYNLESPLSAKENNQVEFCKLLSNYMFYLLSMNPTMLSTELGNWSIALQDTQAEASRFFIKHSISHPKEAYQKLISVETPYRPIVVKGSKSKSLLFDACILAKELQNMEGQWDVMSRVWMELMSFAAISCVPTIHAEQPSRGGELLTFTWLLMNHLGLGMQFSEME